MTTTFPYQLGEPVEHRGIVIAPLFPRHDPIARYVTLDQALPRGLRITEKDAGGSVPELNVANPLAERVLLYDGEELVGAKQNRILNMTVLVEARSTLPIPVSCVEEGRWSTRSAFFDSAAHMAHPEVRRVKSEALAAQPLSRGAAQMHVWDSLREKSRRMGVRSETGAQADVFEAHVRSLGELEAAFSAQPSQAGALLALDDTLCLDWVSRPEAFEQLWPKLRRGYLLDALERLDGEPAAAAIPGFVARLASATRTTGPSAGLGADLRLRGEHVIGSGLELDGELLQISAFTSDEAGARAFGRIARPSRRGR